MIPTRAFANDHISTGDMNFEDDILSITHYDVATKTETIETISISTLQAQNELMMANLGF